MPRFIVRHTWTLALLMVVIGVAITPSTSLAVEPEAGRFNDNWNRTDLPVAIGDVNRTWMWGPAANTFVQWEPYAEAPDGRRHVQHFDKGRMEDNGHRAEAPWDVTMGLLVTEMMNGQIQVGDSEVEGNWPANWINVAGDQGEFASSPTYYSLQGLRIPVDDRTGSVINETVNRAGEVSINPALDVRGVTMAHYDDITGHNIATPIWEYMNSSGPVYLDGAISEAPLFQDPVYVTGRPVIEPYWVTIPVAGTEKDVLLQCFERRCLTYTPDNPEGWRVEAGNVGDHYYEWRYSGRPGEIAFSRGGDIWVMDGDGSNPRKITDSEQFDFQPVWSPDGARLIFARSTPSEPNFPEALALWVVDASGDNGRLLLELGFSHPYVILSFDWSPDGSQVVATRGTEIAVIDVATGDVTREISDLGFVFDLDWSPTSSQILFKRDASSTAAASESGIYLLDAASGDLTQVTEDGALDESPDWSPDGARFVMSGTEAGSDERRLYVLNADGTDRQALPGTEGAWNPRWAPSGDRIAYTVGTNLDTRLWVAYLEGSANLGPQQLSPDQIVVAEHRPLSWSPDSTSVVFEGIRDGRGLYAVALSGRLHNLSADAAEFPDWSP